MWTRAFDLIDEADRLHRRFFQLAGAERALATWEPPADVFEDEREIVVVVAMPGVPAERVQVVSEPGALVVRGVRPLPFTGSRRKVVRLEIPYGAFERRIALPPGTFHLGHPELAEGCLVLRLTRTGAAHR
ncbi:MAG: Hsp20/alpha crystallin family protein [Betaproteobacteria bacterium]